MSGWCRNIPGISSFAVLAGVLATNRNRKLRTRVRFPSPAPGLKRREQLVNSRLFIDVLPSCFFLIFPWSSFI
jgi:hypothetical protein